MWAFNLLWVICETKLYMLYKVMVPGGFHFFFVVYCAITFSAENNEKEILYRIFFLLCGDNLFGTFTT